MIRTYYSLLLSLCLGFFFQPFVAKGQDIESSYKSTKKRLEEDPFKLSGLLRIQGSSYHASNAGLNRGVPYMGTITGMLNVDFMGIKMPVMLNIGSGGTTFNTRLPRYNFVGLSPKFRWVTVHAGTRTMDLGKYTFSNHSFTGGGIELSPKKWRFASFYGRLLRAKPEEYMGIQRVDPVFKRMGFGVKGGFDNKDDAFLVSIFKAWDDPASVQLPDSSLLTPAQNVIVSVNSKKKLGKHLRLEVDYAKSGITKDNRLEPEFKRPAISRYGGLLSTNRSTSSSNAFDAAIKWSIPIGELNTHYERIDPGFRTLGALFFQNDLRNINLGANLRFFKKRLQVSGRLGVQENNLKNDQSNAYKRWVGSANINWAATQQFAVFGSASNFNNVNRRATILNPTTPLIVTELVLTNSDFSGGLNWTVQQSDAKTGIIQFNTNISQGQTIENDEVNTNAASRSMNQMLFYNLQLIPAKWNFVFSVSRQAISFGNTQNTTLSLGLTAGKILYKDKINLSATLNTGANKQVADQQPPSEGILLNAGVNLAWQLSKKANLGFNLSYLNNKSSSPILIDKTTFSELRSSLFFLYTFK